jgi:hypothetical protein
MLSPRSDASEVRMNDAGNDDPGGRDQPETRSGVLQFEIVCCVCKENRVVVDDVDTLESALAIVGRVWGWTTGIGPNTAVCNPCSTRLFDEFSTRRSGLKA